MTEDAAGLFLAFASNPTAMMNIGSRTVSANGRTVRYDENRRLYRRFLFFFKIRYTLNEGIQYLQNG